jgi:hypothetical protein
MSLWWPLHIGGIPRDPGEPETLEEHKKSASEALPLSLQAQRKAALSRRCAADAAQVLPKSRDFEVISAAMKSLLITANRSIIDINPRDGHVGDSPTHWGRCRRRTPGV